MFKRKAYKGMTIGVYGHMNDGFYREIPDAPERFENEFSKYFELTAYLKIAEMRREGMAAVLTILEEGVDDWLAYRIASMGRYDPSKAIPQRLVVMQDDMPITPNQKAVLASVKGIIYAPGSDEAPLYRAFVGSSDMIVLYSHNPKNDMVYTMASSRDIPVEVIDPVEVLREYIQYRDVQPI